MSKEESVYLACGRGFEAVVRFIVKLVMWPFRKRSMVIIGLLVMVAAAIYYDPTGFFATWKAQFNHFFSQLNFSLSGMINACVVLAILYSERLQKVVLPFLDENLDAAKMWRGDPDNGIQAHKFTTGEALLQLAFAIVNAGTINAILGLIGNFGTPLG